MNRGYFELLSLGSSMLQTLKSRPCFYSSRAMIEMLLFTSVLRKPLVLVSPVRNFDNDHGQHTFLHFQFVKKIVTFYSLRHGHDFVRHESGP